jgi:two-component system response regulator GlrR
MGLIEFASGGTLFLDEVHRLPAAAQARLLRVLQEREIVRACARAAVPVDVRVIAAGEFDPDTEVRRGTLREDLYYRLAVVTIALPPLASRRGDIPLLAAHFVRKAARDLDRPIPELRPEAIEILTAHHWPGNVQQLESVMRRVVALAEEPVINADDLPDEIVTGAGERQDAETQGFFAVRQQQMSAFEREYLRDLLARCDGDVTRAAKAAKLPRGTLYRLLKKHSVNAADFRR